MHALDQVLEELIDSPSARPLSVVRVGSATEPHNLFVLVREQSTSATRKRHHVNTDAFRARSVVGSFDPDKGAVTLDGRDLRSLNASWQRSRCRAGVLVPDRRRRLPYP